MTTDELMDSVSAHLQEVNGCKVERLARINKLLDFLQYNKKITELTDEELKDFASCMDGGNLSDSEREKLTSTTDEVKREHYIEMWARSVYFRRCAWLSYLYGETTDKPTLKANNCSK